MPVNNCAMFLFVVKNDIYVMHEEHKMSRVNTSLFLFFEQKNIGIQLIFIFILSLYFFLIFFFSIGCPRRDNLYIFDVFSYFAVNLIANKNLEFSRKDPYMCIAPVL